MPNGGRPLSPPPAGAVTVIGLGSAGCRMLSAVEDAVDRYEPDPAFSYVAIDSSVPDLDANASAEARKIHLDAPTSRFSDDREKFDYLDASAELAYDGGTARRRPVGRYCVDNAENVDPVVEELSGVLGAGSERVEGHPDAHHVWLLSSLGGGTGSGLVPLLAGLVDMLSPQAATFGIGSVPRLDGLESTSSVPPGDLTLYYNAYAALRELRVLLGLGDGDPYPLELELQSDPRSVESDSLALEESPIDAYGLIGTDQAAVADDAYIRTRNRIAADLIVDSAVETDLVAGRPAGGWTNDTTLFSLDGGGFSAPVDDLREFYETAAEREETDAAIERKETRHSSVEDALRGARAVLDRESVAALSDGEADDLPISPEAFARVRDEAASVDLIHLDEPKLDSTIESAAEEIDPIGSIDDEALATYLLTGQLKRRAEAEVHSHPFPEEVEALADEVRDRIDDPVPGADADPVTRWEQTLEPLLRQRRRTIERAVDHTLPVRVFHRREQKSRLERLRERHAELRELKIEYERLREVRSLVVERHERAGEDLRVERDRLEAEVNELREERTELAERRDRLGRRLDALEDALADPSSGRYSTLPVAAPENADPDAVLSADSLRDLVGADVVAGVAVTDALEETVARLGEAVSDRDPVAVDSDTHRRLALSISDPDRELIEITDDEVTVAGFGLPDPTPFERLDDVSGVPHGEPFSVHAVATYAPIALENTSEFGVVHEWYTDPDRDAGALFDRADAEERIARCFAYPELLAADAPDD